MGTRPIGICCWDPGEKAMSSDDLARGKKVKKTLPKKKDLKNTNALGGTGGTGAAADLPLTPGTCACETFNKNPD